MFLYVFSFYKQEPLVLILFQFDICGHHQYKITFLTYATY